MQISIATDTKVKVVICFDRAARVLFGCSADEFVDFAKVHPFAGIFFSFFLSLFFFSQFPSFFIFFIGSATLLLFSNVMLAI